MGNPEGSPTGSITSESIAGFGDNDNWFTAEGSQDNYREWDNTDLDWVDEVTIHVVDSEGVDWYYNLYGPWESIDDLYAQIEDLYEEYGGEAA